PLIMHAFGPPPFPCTSHVSRQVAGQAREFSPCPRSQRRNYYEPMDREVPSPSVAVHGWDEQLRARGYRVTPQRQLVLEAVARLDHATPEDIGAKVQQTARGATISPLCPT